MGTYRIVALDGGGIRGVYTAVLLQRLSKEVPGFLDRADLLAGTSTGGILALALAKGMKPDELVALYQDNGGQIFSRSLLREIGDLGDLIGAKYNNANLEKLLRDKFGDMTLDGLLPRNVLIPSFDLDSPKTVREAADVETEVFSQFCRATIGRKAKSSGRSPAYQRGADLFRGLSRIRGRRRGCQQSSDGCSRPGS